MSREKPNKVKIISIAPNYTDKFSRLFGLGNDNNPYLWDALTETWKLFTDDFGRYQQSEYRNSRAKITPKDGVKE